MRILVPLLTRRASVAFVAVVTGCSLGVGSKGSQGTANPGTGEDAGIEAAASDDAVAPPSLGGTCAMRTPPAGTACACHFTSCHGCAVECDCAPECDKARTDCLVTVDGNGVPHTSDPLLSTGTLTCRVNPATQGELPQPAQLVCTTTNCHMPSPPIGSSSSGGSTSGGSSGSGGGSSRSPGGGTRPNPPPLPLPRPALPPAPGV